MKRSAQLRPLSRQHHGALVLAHRAEKAADSATDADIATLAAQVKNDYRDNLKPHFDEEERWLLPGLGAAGEHALVARTLAEHEAIHAAVARLAAAPDAAGLRYFARLLQDHVRFEERELFAAFERIHADPESWLL